MNYLTVNILEKYKSQLLAFSEFDELKIIEMWGERAADGGLAKPIAKDYEYHYDMELYKKMIFRLRQNRGSASKFYNSVDPCNQQYLLISYGLYDCSKIIDFFAWIGNYLGAYEIEEDLCELWSKNEVKYYWKLDSQNQEAIVKRYNSFLEKYITNNNILS